MQLLRIAADDVDTLAADGRVVHIRDLTSDDLPELLALHQRASDRSIYLRYFSPNREAARRYVTSLLEGREGRHVLGAFSGQAADSGRLVGVGTFDRIDAESAEFALLVADSVQHGGIGTLLLEHLIAEARGAGVRRFVAEVLASNSLMLQVIRDLGFEPRTTSEEGETHVEFDLVLAEPVVDAISLRETAAGAASLRPLLTPRSVVVVGAGREPGTVGHEVLRNLLAAGFTGAVYAVNPHRSSVLTVPCFASPADLPAAPDLAVIAVPAERTAEAVRLCGERGVRAAVVLAAGFGEAGPDGAARQDELLAIARHHGLRLLGPNCVGLVNTDPDVRLDATFAQLSRRPGPLAVLAQSGAFGVGLLAAADARGLGVSQFVSIGNKVDVGGNDLLLAWDADPRTKVIAAYLESIGDPRRFARIAARVSRRKPILVLKSGRTDVGRRAGRSHTAAAASSDVAVDALFAASGVVRVRSMRELLDVASVLSTQPYPGGPRVAIVGNSGGPGVLAADAAVDAGLVVPRLDDITAARLAELGHDAANPLDLGATVQPDVARQVIEAVGGSSVVDAVVTVFTDIAVADAEAMNRAIDDVAGSMEKPCLAVHVGGSSTMRPLANERELPVFAFPEEALAALGAAYRYGCARAEAPYLPARPAGVNPGLAAQLVREILEGGREWLDPVEGHRLLATYGIATCPQRVVHDPEEALTAATELGYPLAAKVAGASLHKSDVGGVRLHLSDDASLRAAVAELLALGCSGVLLQPMVPAGTELIAGAVHDAQCGPLVMVGAGGIRTDVLDDRAFALAPIGERQALALLDRLRSAPLLDGYRGAPMVSRPAVADLLVRLAALVDDVPEIAEVDLNPLICQGESISVVDVRVRVSSAPARPDPLVRQLRGPRNGS